MQEANLSLARKKKAYASLKPTDPAYSFKAAAASTAVDKASKALTSRKDELDRMTDLLKAEMDKVSSLRRTALVGKLGDTATALASQAKARKAAWEAVLPELGVGPAARAQSEEVVSAIARKAEQKARAASIARTAKAGGGAGGAVVDPAAGGLFADAAPIPSAGEL